MHGWFVDVGVEEVIGLSHDYWLVRTVIRRCLCKVAYKNNVQPECSSSTAQAASQTLAAYTVSLDRRR